MEDRILSRDEETAQAKYTDYFSLDLHDLDGNGVQTSLIQAAVTLDVIGTHQHVNGDVPFNLMKSEQPVRVIQDVDYLEIVIRRERRGTSHRVNIPHGPGPLAPAQHLPEQAHRVGGDSPRRHRPTGAHDQARLLLRQPEAVPGPL